VFHRPSFGVAIGRSDEDGCTAHVCLGLVSLYVQIRVLHPKRSREFSIAIHDGSVWIHPWTDPDGDWSSKGKWWRQTICLHVSNWVLGKVRYENRKTETRDVLIPMPEGCYRAVATHEILRHRRRFWPTRCWDRWDIQIPGGIPFSGKGENSWDCGDDGLFGIGGGGSRSLEETIGACVASVLTSRRKNGLDSKGAGREPLRVCNAEAST
jgi:hypothetical protein